MAQKLHHQERFIQICGVILTLSPFANFYLSILPLNVPGKWMPATLLLLAKQTSMSHWALWTASFFVGLMMLKGKRSSWLSVLVILGVFIVFDFFYLKRNLQNSWVQPFLSLATNIFIFGFVYLQEFRQSSAPKIKPAAPVHAQADSAQPILDLSPLIAAIKPKTPAPLLEAADVELAPDPDEVEISNILNYVVDFEGIGPWARVTGLRENEIHMECFLEPPLHIEKQSVDLVLGRHVLILRMHSRQGNVLTFRCEGIRNIEQVA